jgi:cytidyltransferase-like protein
MARVVTIGTFDLFHRGHINLLNECRMLTLNCTTQGVTIGVNSNKFVYEFKGGMVTVPEESRMASVEAYGRPVLHDGDTKAWLEDHLDRGGYLVIGSDWQPPKDIWKQWGFPPAFLDQHDWKLVWVPYTKGVSTTALRERVLSKD